MTSRSGQGARGLTLGSVRGVAIVVQPGTAIALVVIALLFSVGPSFELTAQKFLQGLGLALLLFASVFVHEVSHALVSRAFRLKVREIVLTLWGGHVSLEEPAESPLASGAIGAAGPAANVVIGVVAQGAALVTADSPDYASVLAWLAVINFALAVFNALPGIPLDGGRVFTAIVWGITGNQYRGILAAAWGGRVITVVVIVAAFAFPLALGRSPGLLELMWAGLVVYGLWRPSSAAVAWAHQMMRRDNVTAEGLMVSAVAVDHDISVQQAHDAAIEANATEVVVLAPDGAPAGHFPASLIEAVPAEQRSTTSLQSVTMPLPRGALVPPRLDADQLVEALQEWWGSTDVWVVMDNGTVMGVVRLSDALKAVR